MEAIEFLKELERLKECLVAAKGDNECQHGIEDSMMEFYIDHAPIMDKDTLLKGQETVLSVRNMKFSRWYA